jgi:hypothetical protein
MTDACETLHAYVDGELDAAELGAFEAHLASCDDCTAELPRLLALMSALDAAAASSAPAGAKRLVVIDGGSDAAGRKARTLPRRPRRPLWIAGGAAVAVAAAAVVIVGLPPTKPPPVVSLRSELQPTRLLEARLSYPGTGDHRRLDVDRGATRGEPISMDSRVRLERAKDWHGLAVASLLAGERERAAQLFAQVPPSPHADSDRAALELVDGSQEALERALEDVDRALAQLPNDPAALWNRALVLVGLNLPMAAAREFDRVAALGEQGWAVEARDRAKVLRDTVVRRKTRWRQAYDAGRKVLDGDVAVPTELVGITGTMTIAFYDAVRSAPSRDRALALLPLAQALDAAYGSDRLTAYVHKIAASDFRIRKPLADAYRELAVQVPARDAVDAFLKRIAATGADDLKMGAMVRGGVVGAHLEDYQRLAQATRDPWFVAIAEQETAKAEIARGQVAAAERRLRDALGFARGQRLAYRALLLEGDLTNLQRTQLKLAQAGEELQTEFRAATSAGEWILEMSALADLGANHLDRYANRLARAYMTEILERSESGLATGANASYDCARRAYGHLGLANISLLLLDPDRAREEVSRAPNCGRTFLLEPVIWSELYRRSHRDDDARLARASLAALRAAPEQVAGQDALLVHFEGILAMEVDRAAGQRLLREAIAKAGHNAGSYYVKARAYSFSVLALDAGRASEFAEVIALLAETLEVPKPERCALAIAVQDERTVVAFSDARGQTGGSFSASRKSPELDVSGLVPPATVERLRACERVAVMTGAPVLGTGHLLPQDLAWSYTLARSTSPAPVSTGKRVVVANPLPPPDLKLAPLGPVPDESNTGAVLLRGADATPSRVLLAIRDASVVEFHTHGFIANDVSEASYLVLSPEVDGRYAMTARDVAQIKLDAAPLVILGACHAATSSRTLEGGMGLAEAFLRAGARAVVASPDAVPDLGARTFFAAVRDRVTHGTDPAVAVRDERARLLAASPDNAWVAGIVVFE